MTYIRTKVPAAATVLCGSSLPPLLRHSDHYLSYCSCCCCWCRCISQQDVQNAVQWAFELGSNPPWIFFRVRCESLLTLTHSLALSLTRASLS